MDVENLSKEDRSLLKKWNFNLEKTPTLLFFNSSGEFIHNTFARKYVKDLELMIEQLNDSLNWSSSIPLKYKESEHTNQLIKKYSIYSYFINDKKTVDLLADELYDKMDAKDLLGEKSIANTANYVKSPLSKYYAIWMNNYKLIDSVAPKSAKHFKEKVLRDILSSYLGENVSNFNLQQIDTLKRYIEIAGLSENRNTYTWDQEMKLAFQTKDKNRLTILGEELITYYERQENMGLFVIERFLMLENDLLDFKSIEIWLNRLENKQIEDKEKEKWYCLKVNYLGRTNQLKEKAKIQKECKEFCISRQIDCTCP
jgi:hypothetical protein